MPPVSRETTYAAIIIPYREGHAVLSGQTELGPFDTVAEAYLAAERTLDKDFQSYDEAHVVVLLDGATP